jgi:hypothetical protein
MSDNRDLRPKAGVLAVLRRTDGLGAGRGVVDGTRALRRPD